MELTKNALKAIREKKECRIRLQYELNVTDATIYRWLENNSIMLTTAQALQIISEETGLKQEEILTESTVQS